MSLAESSTKNRNDKESLKLISSVIEYKGYINVNSLIELNKNLSKLINPLIVMEFTIEENYSLLNWNKVLINEKDFKYIRVNLLYLISLKILKGKDEFSEGMHSIFKLFKRFDLIKGSDQEQLKYLYSDIHENYLVESLFRRTDLNKYKHVIFIFKNISYKDCVILFKLSGISIYGGIGSRRHILSSVEYTLSIFLMLISLSNGQHQIEFSQIFNSLYNPNLIGYNSSKLNSEITNPEFVNEFYNKFTNLNSFWIDLNSKRNETSQIITSIKNKKEKLDYLNSRSGSESIASQIHSLKSELVEEIFSLFKLIIISMEKIHRFSMENNLFKYLIESSNGINLNTSESDFVIIKYDTKTNKYNYNIDLILKIYKEIPEIKKVCENGYKDLIKNSFKKKD